MSIIQKVSIPPAPPAPGNHYLIFVSMNLLILGTSYKWNHTTFVLLCQLISVIMSSSFSHVVEHVSESHSFLRLNNIHIYNIYMLYIYVKQINRKIKCDTFCLSIHLLMNIWVGSIFWLMLIMWLWTWQVSVWVLGFNSFGYIPRSGIAGSYGNSMLNFLRKCYTGFHSGCTIFHSHQQSQVSQFLCIHTNPCHFLVFGNKHTNVCEVVYYSISVLYIALVTSWDFIHTYIFTSTNYVVISIRTGILFTTVLPAPKSAWQVIWTITIMTIATTNKIANIIMCQALFYNNITVL